ncbi:MAG TPA: MFS transporter [Colwellia sp.]|nr:MFS transporter [Colwellia sp.]
MNLVTIEQATAEENIGLIIIISLVATIGGFLFGFDSGVINGTIDGLQTAFNSDSVGTGFNVASMLLGCAVGAFFAGKLADQYGRKNILMVSAVFFIMSAYGSGIASSSFEFIIYRIFGGLAVGAASVMAPAYISEVAPARYRGALATAQQVAIILGLFTAFVSNYCLAVSAGGSVEILWANFEAWRWMFWIELIPAIIFIVALFFIPESPRYLILSNNYDEAKRVLKMLFGERIAEEKFKEIYDSVSHTRKPSMKDLLDKETSRIRPIIWVGIALATFQQLVGINVVFYYGAVLWQAVGYSESDALLINIISSAISIGACFVTIYFIDKIGRKPFLLWGSIGMSITLVLMAGAFSSGSLDAEGALQLSDNMGMLALLSANAYVFFFNISWGPVMWVMLGEMFPNQIRGSGLAVSGLSQWTANFAITMTFPILLSVIGLAGAYGIYAFFALLSIIFVIKFISETKGKELEEMEG